MKQRTVSTFLVLYLSVHWAAVLFRVDRFPLSWAPMYSVFKPGETISTRVNDKAAIRKGLHLTHRDGSTSYVSRTDLNMPRSNFKRLWGSLLFGHDPPKHKQGNTSLGSINRWIRGLDQDEPNFDVDWEWRVFWTVNKTLGLEPTDPGFVVRVQSAHDRWVIQKEDLRNGDTSQVEVLELEAVLEWQDSWAERWDLPLE